MAADAPTDAELDAAIAAINEPQRLREAQDLVARAAPTLQRVLGAALSDGGWFDAAHLQALREAVGEEDPIDRLRAVQSLMTEETRLGMLVGVAVGFELSRELGYAPTPSSSAPTPSSSAPTPSSSAPRRSSSAPTPDQED